MILSFTTSSLVADRRASGSRKRFTSILFVLLCSVSVLPGTVIAAEGAIGSRVTDYFASTTGEVTAFVDFHTKNAGPGLGNETATFWSELIVKNYVNLFGSVSLETELVLTVTGPNQQSGTFNTPGVLNPDPAFLEFQTFLLTWQGENTEVKLGKGVIDLGWAEIYSPVNRFNSIDYSKPQHFFHRGEIQLSITRFFSSSELSLTVLPFNEDFIDPPGSSRWLNSRGDLDFFNQIGSRDEDRPHKFPEDWGYLLKYSGVGDGFDYYIAAHHGPGAYPIVQLKGIVFPPKTIKVYPTATSAMAGIVVTRGSWSYYTDVIYQKSTSAEDDDFVRWASGFSYRETKLAHRLGLEEIKPILTYSGQDITEDSDPTVTLFNSEDARPHPKSLLARLNLRFTDRMLVYLLASENFDDEDGVVGIGMEYQRTDSFRISAVGTFMRGKDNTQLGRWRANDYISVGFHYVF
ncbi:MAG TPA: hypothetical protein EYP91_06855 [Gammaproteobacteria bacterium]|nr:hypothetical protein [Gammaproteobacteria bacterium]